MTHVHKSTQLDKRQRNVMDLSSSEPFENTLFVFFISPRVKPLGDIRGYILIKGQELRICRPLIVHKPHSHNCCGASLQRQYLYFILVKGFSHENTFCTPLTNKRRHFEYHQFSYCLYVIATLLDAAKPRPSGALMVTRV